MPTAHFVWYELMTGDVASAASFYAEVVGWQAQDSGMPGVEYTLLKVGEAQVAGMMALPAELKALGMPPSWRGYVAVDDVDASEARLLALRGKVLRPASDIPGVGRFASVTDPQGGHFALFKPSRNDPPPQAAPGAAGTTYWHELHATDGAAAFDFYAALFGWTKGQGFDMGALGTYQLFEIDGVPSGGVMTRDPSDPRPGWRFYVRVDSVEAAAQRVARAGGTLTMAPQQVPDGSWVLNGIDPQGALFALISQTK
jgi:predicted enzyme related to lactoylglutathione lyase